MHGCRCVAILARRLIELCQDDPSGYSNRGYAFRKLGDYEAAVEDYSTAINLSGSSSTRLHNNRAYCLAKLGRYQEAIADYDAVVGLDLDNVHAYHNRCAGLAGRCQYGVGLASICMALLAAFRQCCLIVICAVWAVHASSCKLASSY